MGQMTLGQRSLGHSSRSKGQRKEKKGLNVLLACLQGETTQRIISSMPNKYIGSGRLSDPPPPPTSPKSIGRGDCRDSISHNLSGDLTMFGLILDISRPPDFSRHFGKI